VHRLGKRVAVVSPKTHSMNQVVGLLTGALRLNENGEVEEAAAATHVAGLK
jgi:fructose transport system ATP-binding protein